LAELCGNVAGLVNVADGSVAVVCDSVAFGGKLVGVRAQSEGLTPRVDFGMTLTARIPSPAPGNAQQGLWRQSFKGPCWQTWPPARRWNSTEFHRAANAALDARRRSADGRGCVETQSEEDSRGPFSLGEVEKIDPGSI